ncbi:putative nuclease HARBI1 [Merluccius polli]|uniref:Nuclease HARBI1 n=1 Tax=Merluccius polli TaxID=89951 RepID=A0AA47MAZ3_MERPO|nr:putative nuclease HARBI1 [Merluccius polli]
MKESSGPGQTDPLAFGDDYLIERYRFSGDGLRYLCRLLGPKIQHQTARSHALTVPQMVCVTWRWFASGSFLYSVGDAENLNKGTICCTIRGAEVIQQHIHHLPWPQKTSRRSFTISNLISHSWILTIFCYIIGVFATQPRATRWWIAHTRIKRPSGEHEGDYVNRKSFHSINIQMICDADCLVSNLEAKWPGSVHDSRVFRASPIYEHILSVLLGDKGYACESFLLTPLVDPQTPSQQAYNHAHNKTRARIEMTFGLLKSQFQCLHHLRVSPDRACDVAACAVVLQYVPCMKRTVSVAGTESVTVPPWIPSITGLPLYKWSASSSAGVISWLGGPPPVYGLFLTATIIQTFNMSADT